MITLSDQKTMHQKLIRFYDRDNFYLGKVLNRKESEYRAIIGIVKNLLPKDAKIIDIGCGTGNLLSFLKNLGYNNIKGLELSKRFVSYCRKRRLIVHQTDVLSYKSKHKNDCIIATDLLEHSVYSDELIAKMASLIKPKGFLIIQGPNLLQIISQKSSNRLKTAALFVNKLMEWYFCSPRIVYLKPRLDSQTYLTDDSDACYLVNPFDIMCFAQSNNLSIMYMSTFYNPMARFTKFKKSLVFIIEKLPLLKYMGGTILMVAQKSGGNHKKMSKLLQSLY